MGTFELNSSRIDNFCIDWLTATIECDQGECGTFPDFRHFLAVYFDAHRMSSVAPRFGYQSAEVLLTEFDEQILFVQWGGQGGRLYVQASQVWAEHLYFCLKDCGHVVHVTRLDLALDYREEMLFDYLHDYVRDVFLKKHNIKCQILGDYLSERNEGRSIYLGSRQSPVMLRIYEKGKEQKDTELHDWVRVEWELKPKNVEARTTLLDARLQELLFSNAWSSTFAEHLLSVTVGTEYYLGKDYLPSSVESAINHMCYQYGRILRKYFALHCNKDESIFLKKILGENYELDY